ncbi:MAG TPA: hypothetical protein VEQ58_18135 [Polyangiaceae bacterium]|nr:hypothetical protein [Polyangiaceae bacterium]
MNLELRSTELPDGGQRVSAVIAELGIEELLGEVRAPFVCQTTRRPYGSEPLLTNGSKWLDIWCGLGGLPSIGFDAGVLTLGEKKLSLPPGSWVSLKKIEQIRVEPRACDGAGDPVVVRLVARGTVIKLEIPKLRLSLPMEEAPAGSGLRCQTAIDQRAQRMDLSCSTARFPAVIGNPWFEVSSGLLIVESTWAHAERSGHRRFGIRLPCGPVSLQGLDYRDHRYGVSSCNEVCEDRDLACRLKCPANTTGQPDACEMKCFEREGRCYRACGT